MLRPFIVLMITFLAATAAFADRAGGTYLETIRKTAAMVRDAAAQEAARRHGLQVLDVTWEDTGRYKGSCVGPNISDMTLQIQTQDPHSQQYRLTCLPVVRFPNFSDKTGDVSPDRFFLLVGNEKGRGLRRVTLREFLGDMRRWLSRADSWKGSRNSLLAKRDTHVLVSAQACFLPIPPQGKAEFNPVLFNYQSMAGDPAVLTILATREGTSVTVIDNQRDGFAAGRTWGQRLFYNHDGERASLTGERQSDFKGAGGTQGNGVKAKHNLNMVLLVQVPLKQKNPMQFGAGGPQPCCESKSDGYARGRSDVENAVIGHGKVEGPFTEIDGLAIERDPNYPIRVTVQFYKATSNGVVNEKDLAGIASQINQVYADGDYVGSLVTGGESGRPTEFTGNKVQPKGWWGQFWKQYDQKLGPRSMFNFFRDFNA